MRLTSLFALAALLGTNATAQTVTSPVDSALNVVNVKTTSSWKVWPLVDQAGALVQVEPPATDVFISGTQLLTTLQASATPYVLAGLRVGVALQGMGYYMTECPPLTPPGPCTKPFLFDKPLPPLSVTAGAPVEITYNMPLLGDGSVIASIGDTRAPTAPSGLLAAQAGVSGSSLTWVASWDNVGVSSYAVERCTGLTCTAFARVGTPTVTAYSDTGLAGAQSYLYRVQALDLAGNRSAYSNIAAMTTPSPPPPPPPPAPVCVRIPPVNPAPGTEVKDFTAKMTDSTGAVWTIAPRVLGSDTVLGQVTVKRNGVTQFGGVEYAYIKDNGRVCVADFKSGPGVSCYTGTGWNFVAGAAGC